MERWLGCRMLDVAEVMRRVAATVAVLTAGGAKDMQSLPLPLLLLLLVSRLGSARRGRPGASIRSGQRLLFLARSLSLSLSSGGAAKRANPEIQNARPRRPHRGWSLLISKIH